jgi:alkylhydroperoxidase family enzyme
MSRITHLPLEDWDPDLRAITHADVATPLERGAMRMFAHKPAIAKGVAALGAGIGQDRALPDRLVELVRLRIAFHNQCRSCMAIRYNSGVEDGVDEPLVCSLEKPMEAPNLTEAERMALDYADRFALNHFTIDDRYFSELRKHFSEVDLVELGTWIAFCVGFGRLAATWDMTEELPDAYREVGQITPSSGTPIIVR